MLFLGNTERVEQSVGEERLVRDVLATIVFVYVGNLGRIQDRLTHAVKLIALTLRPQHLLCQLRELNGPRLGTRKESVLERRAQLYGKRSVVSHARVLCGLAVRARSSGVLVEDRSRDSECLEHRMPRIVSSTPRLRLRNGATLHCPLGASAPAFLPPLALGPLGRPLRGNRFGLGRLRSFRVLVCHHVLQSRSVQHSR